MASVASRLIEEVTAHAQSDSLEDAREICADGTYFRNNLRKNKQFMFSNVFPENFAGCEIIWQQYGTAGQATDDNIIRRMRIACWITNTKTQS